jgi:thiol-disulfide isomerase/thioredoxin
MNTLYARIILMEKGVYTLSNSNFKTMKRTLLIILNVFLAYLLIGQVAKTKQNPDDPFCRMVTTIYSLEALSFNSQFNEKQVFENDTVTTFAKVIVKKKGTSISFLQIIPEAGKQELLFYNDSAWLADHSKKTIVCLGTDIDALTHNHLSEFLPFSIYTLDTTICMVEPFWKIIDSTKDYTVISLELSAASEDVSDIRVEFTIGNSDLLLQKTLRESVYMKSDKLFQEQVFSSYSLLRPGQVNVPGYFTTYEKDFSIVQKMGPAKEKKSEEMPGEIYLRNIELFDLAGKPFNLPQEGLILLDLWYVGCSPCMKSAPVIEKLYNEYHDKVYFFSVNEIDQDTEKISRFKEKMGITFPVLLGGKEKLAGKINGGNGYPLFILMDAESGKVLWKMEGYSENLEELITDAIRQNL